jgi:hypothetical protein
LALAGTAFLAFSALFKDHMKTLDEKDRVQFVCKVVPYFAGLIMGTLGLCVAIGQSDKATPDLWWGEYPLTTAMMGIHMGFMAFEVLSYMFRKDFFFSMKLHHGCTVFACAFSACYRFSPLTVVWAHAAELSLLFAQNNWYLKKLGQVNTVANHINSAVMALCFLARSVCGLYLMYLFAIDYRTLFDLAIVLQTSLLLHPLLFTLNAYWAYLSFQLFFTGLWSPSAKPIHKKRE